MAALAVIGALAMAGCSDGGGDAESAGDYASRVGSGAADGSAGSDAPGQDEIEAMAAQPDAAVAAIPAGADVKRLERLGNIANVDLGPRDGGCTFAAGGTEMLASGGNARSGRAAVRVGGELVMLDAGGGLDAIRGGTTFSAPGVSVSVAPAAGNQSTRPANLVVTDGGGQAQSYSGNWICG